MYKVRLVLQQLVDALNDVSLAQHNLVIHWHEFILHFCFQAVYKMDSLIEKLFKKLLLDIPSVGKKPFRRELW